MDATVTIGVDIGGTFTDLVLFDRGTVRIHKVSSTPQNPALAVVEGVSHFTKNLSANLEIIHGTTVATNTLIERKGAKIALITTKGFEDIIEIGRQNRGKLYNLFWKKNEGLVPRPMRIGVEERTNCAGFPFLSPSDTEMEKVANAVKALGAEAVAVCFLHSYANPAHEAAVGRSIDKLGIPVSLSSVVSPEFREYERSSTTVANAYLIPVISDYMKSLSSSLGGVKVSVIQSSGGVTEPDKVAREPVRITTSGPAAGVSGAFKIAECMGETKIITCDMGGTSTDVSLCNGVPMFSSQSNVGGVPLRVPCIDISTIGAGGGSIARTDAGGILKTGPESAGADPGPACYGKGKLPTVTDANLVLGRMEPEHFLGGRKKIFPQRAFEAIQTLEMDNATPLQKAESVVRVVNSSMERLIRVMAADRGVDPREFSLFGFGGAAGLHCCEIALGTGMKRVIFPCHPAALSALGMLLSDLFKDYVKSCFSVVPEQTHLVSASLSELEKAARAEHKGAGDFETERFVDLRYAGQSHEITVPFSSDITSDFHLLHCKRFGYAMNNKTVETTAARIRFMVGKSGFKLPEIESHTGENKETGEKDIWINGSFRRFGIYRRPDLGAGFRFEGPALVLEDSSVLMITPEFQCEVDRWGNIVGSLR